MTFSSDETATLALRFWQKQLRLQDWDITVKIVRRSKMPSPGSRCFGEVEWSRIYRKGDISLLNPEDFADDDDEHDRDMEQTLVHELLHLVLKDCNISSRDTDGDLTNEGVAEERAIEALSTCLSSMNRKTLEYAQALAEMGEEEKEPQPQ